MELKTDHGQVASYGLKFNLGIERDAAEAAILHDAMWSLTQDVPLKLSPFKRRTLFKACEFRLRYIATPRAQPDEALADEDDA